MSSSRHELSEQSFSQLQVSEIEDPKKGEKRIRKRRKLEGSLRSEIKGHGRIRRPFWPKFPASSTSQGGSETRQEGVGREEVLQCNAMQARVFLFCFVFLLFLSLLWWLLCCVCVSWFLVSNNQGILSSLLDNYCVTVFMYV